VTVVTVPEMTLDRGLSFTRSEGWKELALWERDALAKLRILRSAGKPAILFMTEDGVILAFEQKKAGRIEIR